MRPRRVKRGVRAAAMRGGCLGQDAAAKRGDLRLAGRTAARRDPPQPDGPRERVLRHRRRRSGAVRVRPARPGAIAIPPISWRPLDRPAVCIEKLGPAPLTI